MRHLKSARRAGTTLVAVLYAVLVCGALSAAVVVVNLAAQREANTLIARERAFHLAEAGIDWALAEIRVRGGALLPDPVTTVAAHDTGDFVIRTYRDSASTSRILSTGRAGGIERTLQVTLHESVVEPTVTASMQFNVDFPIVDLRGNAFSIDGRDHAIDGTVDDTGTAVYGLASPAAASYLEDQIDSSRHDQVVGTGGTPSIGTVDPIDLDRIVDQAKATAEVTIPADSTQTHMDLGEATSSGVTVAYADGDVHISGNSSGAGILAVDGDLRITGSFTWVGIILVRGRVIFAGGGGTKRVIGALIVGEEVTQTTGSTEASVSGTVDLLYSSAGVDLALQAITTMRVATWQEVGNP